MVASPPRLDIPATDALVVLTWSISRLPLPVARRVLRTAIRVGEDEALAMLAAAVPHPVPRGVPAVTEALIDALALRISPDDEPDDGATWDELPTEPLTLIRFLG